MMNNTQKRIDRLIEGNYSRRDLQTMAKLFEEGDPERELYSHMKESWNSISSDEQEETISEFKVNKLLSNIHKKIETKQTKSIKTKFLTFYKHCAAILLIPLLVTSLMFIFKDETPQKESYAEIICPMGVRTKFELPDGTSGFLNGGSTLCYNVDMSSERKVKLTGEAYFDVYKTKEKPFVVKTKHLDTKVLGTQFNVIAYEGDIMEQVILKEGCVEVYKEEGKLISSLTPNESVIYNAINNKAYKRDLPAWKYIGWTEGKFILRNDNFEEVAKRMERWYNIEIDLKDSKVKNFTFHGTFVDETPEQILKLLAITAPFQFEEKQREQSGPKFEKRHFIIRYDKNRAQRFNMK